MLSERELAGGTWDRIPSARTGNGYWKPGEEGRHLLYFAHCGVGVRVSLAPLTPGEYRSIDTLRCPLCGEVAFAGAIRYLDPT